MATEPKTGLTYWPSGALQPDLLFNEFLMWAAVWTQATVLDQLGTPPGSPDEGDIYIVNPGASGAWAGYGNYAAYWTGTTWFFFAPQEGYEVYDLSDDQKYRYFGSSVSAWVVESTGTVVSSVNGDTGTVIVPVPIGIACSDESTALTTGTAKATFRMPFAMTLTGVRANLNTAQASGSIFTVDINESGTTILSTKLTIDNTEKTSTTAATPPVISDTSLADDAEITIDIDQVGTSGAKGLKVWLLGYPT